MTPLVVVVVYILLWSYIPPMAMGIGIDIDIGIGIDIGMGMGMVRAYLEIYSSSVGCSAGGGSHHLAKELNGWDGMMTEDHSN